MWWKCQGYWKRRKWRDMAKKLKNCKFFEKVQNDKMWWKCEEYWKSRKNFQKVDECSKFRKRWKSINAENVKNIKKVKKFTNKRTKCIESIVNKKYLCSSLGTKCKWCPCNTFVNVSSWYKRKNNTKTSNNNSINKNTKIQQFYINILLLFCLLLFLFFASLSQLLSLWLKFC